MKISSEKPEIYDRLKEKFGDVWERGVIITYGDTVYTKGGGMALDLHVHEQVHIDQQAVYPGGPAAWWEKFLEDPKFRLEQEIPAYNAQVKYIRQNVHNRRKQETKIEFIYHSMADNYAGMVTVEEAKKLLS